MNQSPPIAEDPMAGYLSFEQTNDIRSGAQIRINTEHFYEVLSIREDDTVLCYDHETQESQLFSSQEIKQMLLKDDSYLWSILNRETVQIGDLNESVILYYYGAEFPDISTDDRVLVIGWCTDDNYPPETVSNFTEMSLFANFMDVRDAINSQSECFEELYDRFTGDINNMLHAATTAAEYNAESLFELQHKPTYDDELQRTLERQSKSIENTVEQYEGIYR